MNLLRYSKNIIKIYNDELVEVFHEDGVHEAREFRQMFKSPYELHALQAINISATTCVEKDELEE